MNAVTLLTTFRKYLIWTIVAIATISLISSFLFMRFVNFEQLNWTGIFLANFVVASAILITLYLLFRSTLSKHLIHYESVRHNQQLIDTLANALPMGILLCDLDFKIQYANETYLGWRSESLDNIVGKSVEELTGETVFHSTIKPYLIRASRGCREQYEIATSYVDKLSRDVLINLVPIRNSKHEISGILTILTDITLQKKMQENLKLAKNKAEEANKQKTFFLAAISHEIRNPIAAIAGFSKLLSQDNLSASEKHDFLEVIERNNKHLNSLLADILDISKIEAGTLEIHKRDFQLSNFLKELFLNFRTRAEEKGLKFELVHEFDYDMQIHTDPDRLKQIVTNICSNAIKYTSEGKVVMSVSLTESDEKRYVCVTIKDSGPGIPKEEANKLYRPFTRLSQGSNKFSGTGIGLSLSKNIAQLLGGDVTLVDSTPNQGSTFKVTAEVQPVKKLDGVQIGTEHPLSHNYKLRGKKLLLAEDSPDLQILERHFLEDAGAIVDLANDGVEAVSMSEKKQYDAIILDIEMPKMNGMEAARRIRSKDHRCPILALTARAMNNEFAEFYESGFDACLSKPLDNEALVEQLVAQIARHPHTPPERKRAKNKDSKISLSTLSQP